MAQAVRSAPPSSWLERAVSGRWPGSSPAAPVELKGDASTRRFWRVQINGGGAPTSAIIVDLGPDDLPLYARALELYPRPLKEPPYLDVHRYLESLGAPVPEIYHALPGERLLLVEDVGDKSLFQAATENPGQAADLYRLAVEELLRLHVDGTARRNNRCVAFGVNYDQRLFGWELGQFAEFGLTAIVPGVDRATVASELADLAERLGRLPRVFSHRDYHGHNLFLQEDLRRGLKIRILDFQDALMAPHAQDLALLLTTRDTSRVITPAIESRLLNYYLAGLARRGVSVPEPDRFAESYRLCVLQHALKLIGSFERLERSGKRGYAAFVPHGAAQARRMLARGADFPNLKKLFETAR